MKRLLVILVILISTLGFSQSKMDTLVFTYINEYRVSNGINPLIWDTLTYKVGVEQVSYMSETNTCNHDQTYNYGGEYNDTLFREKFRRNGVSDSSFIGENLTIVWYIDIDTISNEDISCMIFQNWIDSPEHHELLLDSDFSYGSITHKVKEDIEVIIEDPETYELLIYYYDDGVYASFQCRD